MNSTFEIPARYWAWYVCVSLVAVVVLPIVGRLIQLQPLITFITTTILLICALAGLLFFGTKKNKRTLLAVSFIFCAFFFIILIKFLFTPIGIFLPALASQRPRNETTFPLGIFSLFFSATGTFFFYRALSYVCERFFGRRLNFFRKKNGNVPLLKIISRVVFCLIGVSLLVLIVFDPTLLLLPAFLLLPFASQAGVFFHPLYGWLTAAFILLFLACYAVTCHRMKTEDILSGNTRHIDTFSWSSMAILVNIHLFWILSMKTLAIVLAIESFRPSLFLF